MQTPPAHANPAGHWHSALPAEDPELAGHVAQPAVPTALLNVPASHALHVTPSEAAVYPGMHLQPALPATELECEGHAAQIPAPAVALNVPASHATQGPMPGPVYPGRQVLQSASSSLPTGEL